MIIRLTIVFLLLGPLQPLAAKSLNDTLTARSFDYLYDRIESTAGTTGVRPYLEAYLKKAKKKNDWEEIYNAYKNYLYESPNELRLTYTDSMVYAAEKTDNNELIGDAFLTRGVIHYNLKNHIKALDCYVIANRLIAGTDNNYLKFKTKYNIALIKYYLGYYNEALSLYLESADYFKDGDQSAYANCLHNLALTYNRLDKIKESIRQNAKALHIAHEIGYSEILPHLTLLEGVNLFHTRDYTTAIEKIENSFIRINKDKDFATVAVAYFYLGQSYWELDNPARATYYFELMDKVVDENNYIRPDLRPAYERLIDYYHGLSDTRKELYYIKKLLKLDKRIEADFNYLSKKVHKGYDTYDLNESKVRIEHELRNKKAVQLISFTIIAALAVGLFYAVYHHFKMKRKYRQRFEEYILKKEVPVDLVAASNPASLDINPEVIDTILKKLGDFERKNGFLKKDITANSLCKDFDTNYKYMTKVIHHYRNKNFTAYLNDLRIEYIVEELKQNSKIRNYKTAALAGEAGFNTAQHFTRAFINKLGMPPSFFIQELEKMERQDKEVLELESPE